MTKTIDYRVVTWGHNHYFTRVTGNKYFGPCWYRKSINVDDIILWKTNYGYCEATVRNVKSHVDPVDMFNVEVEVIKRHADPEIVSQEELDMFFEARP